MLLILAVLVVLAAVAAFVRVLRSPFPVRLVSHGVILPPPPSTPWVGELPVRCIAPTGYYPAASRTPILPPSMGEVAS